MIPVSNGLRMLDGEVIYRDFYHFITPGADLYYETLFRIFGVRVWLPNVTVLLLSLAQIVLIWFIARKILINVYLPTIIFLVIGFRQFGIDGSHRLFSIVFVLLAVVVLIDKRSMLNLATAGFLCGIATFFVQPRGLLAIAAIFVFLIWEHCKNGLYFRRLFKSVMVISAAFAGTAIVTQSYFLWHAGFENYYFSMVTFLQQNYRADPLNNFSSYFSDIPDLGYYWGNSAPVFAVLTYIKNTFALYFYYLLIPGIYFVFLLYRWRKRDVHTPIVGPKLLLICLIGIFLAAGVSAPTAIRLYQVAIPGLILLVWLCQRGRIFNRFPSAALILLSLVGVTYVVQRQLVTKFYLEMPAGYAAFLYKPTFERYAWIGANTMPGEFLFEPQQPDFYFPFHLKNPTPLFNVRDSEYTPKFQVDAVIRSLDNNRPRLIIWPEIWSKPAGSRIAGDNLGPLWQFVQDNYKLKYVFEAYDGPIQTIHGNTEVWELKH